MNGKQVREGVMAKWDLDQGYVKIPTDILRALARQELSGGQFRLLLVQLSKTWEGKKPSVSMSYNDFARESGLSRSATIKFLQDLVARNVLLRTRPADGRSKNIWTFQDDSEKWLPGEKKPSGYQEETSHQEETTLVTKRRPEVVTRKRPKVVIRRSPHINKEIKKESSKKGRQKRHPDHRRLMALYREAIREDEGLEKGKELDAPGKENKAAQKILQAGFTPEEAMECYRHFKEESFWRDKHLSLTYIAQNIGAWRKSKAGRPKDERYRDILESV